MTARARPSPTSPAWDALCDRVDEIVRTLHELEHTSARGSEVIQLEHRLESRIADLERQLTRESQARRARERGW